jgi:ABC-type polysaccharide transport system permease subunit
LNLIKFNVSFSSTIGSPRYSGTSSGLGSGVGVGTGVGSFFNSYQFSNLIKNTLTLSVYSLIAGFPAPILLALMLNDVSNERFKKLVQTLPTHRTLYQALLWLE